MTLLIPTTLPPNYGSAAAPDWKAIPIAMPDTDGAGSGIRADLDSGASTNFSLQFTHAYILAFD